MERLQRKKEELQEASNHLHYEIGMSRSTANGLTSSIGCSAMDNALVESFVIHSRNLIDFCYPPKNVCKNDTISEDFFSSPEEWTKIRPTLSNLLDSTKKRANKELAHLTYARIGKTIKEKQWHFIEIVKEIDATLNLFLKRIPKELLGSQRQQSHKDNSDAAS